jgi:hypothetical protein
MSAANAVNASEGGISRWVIGDAARLEASDLSIGQTSAMGKESRCLETPTSTRGAQSTHPHS